MVMLQCVSKLYHELVLTVGSKPAAFRILLGQKCEIVKRIKRNGKG